MRLIAVKQSSRGWTHFVTPIRELPRPLCGLLLLLRRSVVGIGADVAPQLLDIACSTCAPPSRHRILAVENRTDEPIMLICMEPPEIEANATIVAQTLAVTSLTVLL